MRNISANIATTTRIFLVLSRSLSHQPMMKNSTTETMMSIICLNISAGAEVATTDRPRVVRKKASISTSKPLRRMLRMAK